VKRRRGAGEARRALAAEVVHHQRPGLEPLEHFGLLVEGTVAVGPQLVRLARREVAPGVAQQGRHRAEQLGQPGVVGGAQRIGEIVQVDVRLGRRALVRGDVAHLGEDGLVEARIARPRLQYAEEEVEAVQLRLDEPIITALGRAPAGSVDGFQPVPELGKASRLH